MLYSTCVPKSIFRSPYLHSTWNSPVQANTATTIQAAIIARCTLLIDNCIMPIAHCLLHQPAAHNLLPIASFRRSGPAECAERLNPPPLPLGKSWRVRLTAEVHILRSHLADLRPPHISPSGPAHSAGPPQNVRGAGFYDFQKTLAVAERAAKKLCTTELGANLHHKCNLQDGFSMKF